MPPPSTDEREKTAERALPRAWFDFIAGGAGAEKTTRANVAAFAALSLRPRVMRAAGPPDASIELLGCELRSPMFVAPTAFHRLVHPLGEIATAQAAKNQGVLYVASLASTAPIESVAAAGGNVWMQIYLQTDKAFESALIERCEAAGCKAIVVTIDSPVLGRKRRDERNGFHDLPPGLACENMREPLGAGRYGEPRPIQFSTALGWRDFERARSATRLPFVAKGILRGDDARLALEAGADAIYVSNHGGRQLDGAVASIDALAEVRDAVGDRAPILIDGGARTGEDVLCALALGARAVGLGRPALWALAAAGADGLERMLGEMREDFERALSLCGCASARDLTRDLVRVSGKGEK